MRKRLLLSLGLLASLVAVASPVDESQALATARQFFADHGISMPSKARASVRRAAPSSSQSTAWYAFNGDGLGFVIVSGDDRTAPVLGYSLSGSFDYDSAPDNMKAWLDMYAAQIDYLQTHNVTVTTQAKASTTRARIEPMMKTTWNQDEPYNNACPDFFSYGKSVTGCLATAMAQVLYYNYEQHPTTITRTITKEIPGYSCSKNWQGLGKISVNAVPAGSVIDWANMLPEYTSSATTAQETAVANLMAWCGTSLTMEYANGDNGGSSAGIMAVPQALVNYFDFDKSVQVLKRDAFTSAEWNDRVYEELQEGHVVLYAGFTEKQSGHAFVIHGYDADNYFYVNWGWGGYADGAFLLSVLKPEQGGIGAGTIAEGYNQDMSMLVNAFPNQGGTAPLGIGVAECSINGATISFTAANWGQDDATCRIGFAQVTDDGLEAVSFSQPVSIPKPEGTGYYYKEFDEDFSKLGLANGTYKIVPVVSAGESFDWQRLWSPSRYLQVVIDGDDVTITEMPAIVLSAENLAAGSVRKTGLACSISADITNGSTEEFSGSVYLFASTTDEKGVPVASDDVSLAAGATDEASFSWVPAEAGTYVLWVCSDAEGKDVLCSGSIEIAQGEVEEQGALTLSAINVTGSDISGMDIDDDGRVVVPVSGNAIEGECTVKLNEALSNTNLFVSLFQYNSAAGTYSEYPRIRYSWSTISGSAGQSTTLTFSFTDLPDGKYMIKIAAGTFNTESYKIDPEIWSDDNYCVTIGTASGIAGVTETADAPTAIYTLTGTHVATVKASQVAATLQTLPKGIYVVNGKKLVKP